MNVILSILGFALAITIVVFFIHFIGASMGSPLIETPEEKPSIKKDTKSKNKYSYYRSDWDSRDLSYDDDYDPYDGVFPPESYDDDNDPRIPTEDDFQEYIAEKYKNWEDIVDNFEKPTKVYRFSLHLKYDKENIISLLSNMAYLDKAIAEKVLTEDDYIDPMFLIMDMLSK